MKKILFILFLVSCSLLSRAQFTKPAGVHNVPQYSFFKNNADSTITMYMWSVDLYNTLLSKFDSVKLKGYATQFDLLSYKLKNDSITNPGYFTNFKALSYLQKSDTTLNRYGYIPFYRYQFLRLKADTVLNTGTASIWMLSQKRALNNHDSLSRLDERKYQSLTDTVTWGLGLGQSGHVVKVDTSSASILSRERALKEYALILHNQSISTIIGLLDSLNNHYTKAQDNALLAGKQPLATVLTNIQDTLNLHEHLANKSTTTTLGTSNILYPTQNAVKIYTDNGLSSADTLNVHKAGTQTVPGKKTFSNIAALTTSAESWIGPSSTDGIYFKNGNRGFGTTSPSGLLTVAGANTASDGSNGVKIQGGGAGYGTGLDLIASPAYSGNTWSLVSANNQGFAPAGSFSITGSATPKLTILSTGNVGIGTISPGNYKLYTNGTGYFATSLTTPTVNLTTGAAVNYTWQCTNSTTGAGHWANVTNTQTFISTWDANANLPFLEDGTGTNGYYHTVQIAGDQDLGSGSIHFEENSTVIYNGLIWQKLPAPSITGAALTKTDDTNITLTLGGSPSSALINATSITAGWTGTLADGRIASAATWNAKLAVSDTTLLLFSKERAAKVSSYPTFNQSTTGNAATVTTNADLTGPITSVGNTTSITSQTGTGSTFAMSVSPTFTGTVTITDGTITKSAGSSFVLNTGMEMSVLKVTGGAGAGKVLLSDVDGDLSYSASALGASAFHADNFFATAAQANATHTGDVTGATALTIGAGKVTLAMQANMATASLIYRKTAGAGAPEVNSLATLKTDLGLTGTNSGDQNAAGVSIADAGGIITGTNVETALQENRTAINLNTAKVTNATHSGDATGSTALTLATVNSNVGTYQGFTVNAKGLVTAASNQSYLVAADISGKKDKSDSTATDGYTRRDRFVTGLATKAALSHNQAQTTITALPDSLLARYTKIQSNAIYVPKTLTITATAPLTIAGTTSADLSANRTIAISAATTSVPGSMSAADKTKLDGITSGATANTGTVTSVTGGTGITGGTITTTGTLAIDTTVVAKKTTVASMYQVKGFYQPLATVLTNIQDSINNRYRRQDTATVLLSKLRAGHDYQPKGTYLSTAIISLGGLTGATQTFGIGTTGTAPNWSSATTVHTLNVPSAGTASVTAGTISKTEYDTFNAKQAALVSTTNIKSINGTTILGSGDLSTTQTTVSGNAGTVTVAANTTNATYYPLFATSATGSLAPQTTAAKLTFNPATGVLKADVFQLSDRRYKNHIKPLDSSDYAKIAKIEFRKFYMNDDPTNAQHFGVVAQQIEDIGLRQFVDSSNPDEKIVNYRELSISLLAQQAEEIKLLKEYTKQLEKRISKLERKNRWKAQQLIIQ